MIRAETAFALNTRPSMMSRLVRWASVARQRRALAALDETALRDLGLTQAQANREAARPFWDAPEIWRN